MTQSKSEIFDFSSFKKLNGVTYLSNVDDEFEKLYIDTRNKESRVLNDDNVKFLPVTDSNHKLHEEWRLRRQTSERFLSYLEKNKFNSILDIGCGNGWFTNLLAQSSLNSRVVGIDINKVELEQASRVFKSESLEFLYLDIFDNSSLFDSKFDLITLNASVQYFPDFDKLIERLKDFLIPNGEIHILDSPFYKKEEVSKAKERTNLYYKSHENERLCEFYFHHSLDDMSEFKILYRPKRGLIKRLINPNQSPFLWLRFKNNNQVNSVKKGFSKIAEEYEELEKNSSLIQYKRKIIRSHFLKRLDKESELLEINCGSGLDALYFAQKGHTVLATDFADGMLQEVRLKVEQNNLDERLSCEKLSFDEIGKFGEKRFSGVFSNFGGLNCINDTALNKVLSDFGKIVKPGGVITLVIMPKVTFYEWFRILKGNKSSFRRLKRGGVIANVKGEKVQTYYHSAKKIKKILEKDFGNIQIENIFTFGPSGSSFNFPNNYPKIFKFLNKIDKFSSKTGFLRGFGDYYIISGTKK